MEIYGLIKLTLLDFPGRLACTAFTGGCNFRCPFCHNSDLVKKTGLNKITDDEFFSFLKKRTGRLDGVCISGGEPLLQSDLTEFAKKIHGMGFSVKLDTNGYMPDRLRSFTESGFCDFIAMDVKNSPQKYAATVGLAEVDTDKILESIEYIKSCGIDHEFRTTVAREFHNADDIREITKMLAGEERYFIQPYKESDGVMVKGLHGFDATELAVLLSAARENIPAAEIRG